ncbi:MAG TPA: hypothetical protein VMZ74_14415 [Ramlibacter sp.]|nr:hypothetical protein [Ramlibacter sp.]
MKKTLIALAAAGIAFCVAAKLPAPDDAAKAKAAEAAAKAAWQGKVDAYMLCKVQDKIAAKYGKHDGKQDAKATPASAKPAASGASAAAAGSTPTPAVASAPPPCMDAGPFAYNPPEQKPLEASEAHSPAGTAASPPSNRAEAAKMQPSGKTATKK